MPGRVVSALIRREVETYRAQGLPEEALNLLETTLQSNPDLPGNAKAGFLAQLKHLQAEIAGDVPDEQAAISDEAIEVIRRGWEGSDTLEDHLESAAGFHALDRCTDALGEFALAARKGQPLNRILPQMADCLARAHPPEAVAQETERLAGAVIPHPTPEKVFLFELVAAEMMTGGRHPEHAAALARRLVVSGAMPGRCRERVQALAEKTIGVAGRPERLSILNRLRARLGRPAPSG